MDNRETRPTLTADALLARYPDATRATMDAARDLVRQVVPEVEERVYPGWRALGYHHPSVGYFCGLFPSDEGVTIAFERGAELSDPFGLLTLPPTSARTVRYVRVNPPATLDERGITALLLQAVSLAGRRRSA